MLHSNTHSYVAQCVRVYDMHTHLCKFSVCDISLVTFSTFRVLTVQSGRTSSDTFEMRMSPNTDIGLLSSGQYL